MVHRHVPLELRPFLGIGSRCALGLFSLCLVAGCGQVPRTTLKDRLIASNQRDWSPQFQTLPRAVIADDQVTLYHVRNNVYLGPKDFIVQHYDRLLHLSDIQTVDFIIVPFQNMESIAHTMVSFGLADGTYIAVSVEVRTEKGESYTTALGLSHQFELTYVVADERDVIRLRTRHRQADVYIYPSRATPDQAQRLFVDMMQRVNSLADKPEFYDTITNNCTNNLVRHVNHVFPDRVPSAWQILFSGHSDRFAYDLGLLDQRLPFEELKPLAHVNDLAEQYYDAPDFSQKIRTRLTELKSRTPAVENSAESSPRAAERRLPRAQRPGPRWAQLLDSLRNQGRTRNGRSAPADVDEGELVEPTIEE
jgi:hypothetical protein